MRTAPAKRYNSHSQHNQYGIFNWFKSKGIKDHEIIKEVVGNFCIETGMDVNKKTNEFALFNYAGNRFQKLAQFAIKYLKENNYL